MSVVSITYYIINNVNVLLYLDTCILPPVTGSCTRSVTRWYFNHMLGKCQSFIYSGCDGNSNNFESLEKCVQACGKL